ncbi:hypothetical protein GQ53DRAFT_426988 [Thozetella sp. PMI_491]|nr:hypothetical protein GQ53DRAFT_426988 [Thozetella sp. PMI_491]
MSSLFTAPLYPRNGLGFLVLGASLHDILTRLKAEPQRFPKLDLLYSPTDPIQDPITLALPANGLRLRFDGPKQQLRLIEVVDFTKNQIYLKPNDKELYLVRAPNNPPSAQTTAEAASGPTFRHIYQRYLGPTYNGEFLPDANDPSAPGTYVLSYPGVAFTFPMLATDYSPDKDVVSLMSSSTMPQIATSMAIFSGDSWTATRENLWTEELPSIRTFAPLAKGKDVCPEEISHVLVHGGGELELRRTRLDDDIRIRLGKTTSQELVANLGPPDAIYRKNDQRMYVHKLRAASNTMTRPSGNELKRQDDLTDTDQSSAHGTSDDQDSSDEAVEDDLVANVSEECFYNYFYLGFDILVSTPTAPSRRPPSQAELGDTPEPSIVGGVPDRLVATKMVLHGNVPGSYPFNRHRRCRWAISYLKQGDDTDETEFPGVTSETPFPVIEEHLKREWMSIYGSEDEARQQQRGMVLNRGWGDSPGSSCELLGGWEESRDARAQGKEDSTTTLYGFPGLVFEVLKNGYVSAVTVY